ncbi:MAG: adenylate/guanylate cyclase domain-containing protein [Flavisolibacter sp.]
MNQRRQLSAILFTDIEGYTAIMQRNEQKALIIKDRHRDILEKEHKNFNGRIVQYYGDGTLSIFQSVIEAVSCALSMQQKFCQLPQVPVRMGLHMGDIIVDDGNVFGDGVNVAARIESLGMAGSVLLSDKANDELHNHPEIKTISVGHYQLKNINRLIEVFALNHDELVIPEVNSLKGKTEEKKGRARTQKKPDLPRQVSKTISQKSIAVLPFVNMSNDPEQEYFSDGMAEEIINSLTHLRDLKVAGRSSSLQFKGKNTDLREVGHKLSVRTVLEGSVRKQGNRLRITVQMTDVEDGYHIWSEKYDRELDDIFSIQDDIALAITEKLRLTLIEKDKELIIRNFTQNTEAYELYLKGRFYLNRRGASINLSMQYFQKAINIDPGFALAHVGYSDANLLIASYGLLPPKEVMTRAKQSAERALELDPSLSEPYSTLGYYYALFEWNWPEAKKNFLQAIEVNPGFAEGHIRYGWIYLACIEGKFEEAEKHGQTGINLEPLSSICYANYSLILHCAGKFKEALEACQTGIELDANSYLCHVNAGLTQMALQRYEDALSSFETAMRLSNRHYFTVNGFIWNYCLSGQFDKAQILMNELKERSRTEYVANALTAISAAYLDQLDDAFYYLEKAFQERDPVLIMLQYDHWAPAKLKTDPRFSMLLERVGLPKRSYQQ